MEWECAYPLTSGRGTVALTMECECAYVLTSGRQRETTSAAPAMEWGECAYLLTSGRRAIAPAIEREGAYPLTSGRGTMDRRRPERRSLVPILRISEHLSMRARTFRQCHSQVNIRHWQKASIVVFSQGPMPQARLYWFLGLPMNTSTNNTQIFHCHAARVQ